MKKIYNILIIAIAILGYAPFTTAQTSAGDESDYHEKNGFAYSKTISEPNTQGIYTITLESFVTGKVSVTNKSLPADIVLVLDYSGSMAFDMNGRQRGSQGFDANNVRIDVLKDAVKQFIEAIDDNDLNDPETGQARPDGRLGNKISIVTFAGSANTVAGLTALSGNGKTTLINAVNGLNNPNGGTQADLGMQRAYDILSPLGDDRQLRTVVLFTDGDPGNGNYWESTERVRDSNYNRVTVLTTNGVSTWTTANATINIANNIKNLADQEKEIISNVYTVSIVTSPSQYTNVYLGKTSSNWENATNMATLQTTQTWNSGQRYLPPDWNGSNIWSNGNGRQVSGAFAFATIDPEELKNIFKTIAESSGGSSAHLGESSVSQVDVVSASFMLPPGSDASAIKVYTVAYVNDDAAGNHIFETNSQGKEVEVLAPSRTDTYTKKWVDEEGVEHIQEGVDVDNGIQVILSSSSTATDAKKDKIEVKGFDYENLFCGPDETTTSGWHKGYKLIIRIPIKMDPEAVGGPNRDTNGPGSGIYIDGVNQFPFESPVVSLPVNIHIRKEGLDVGESAKFTIQRTKDGGTTWEDVTSVFVTRHEGDAKDGVNAPITKVVGMPSTDDSTPAKPFIYRIKEDDWSWSYISGHTTPITTDLLESNPFIFTNTKRTGIDTQVRHAESKATNTFKTGVTNVEYDDSKTNTRTQSGSGTATP